MNFGLRDIVLYVVILMAAAWAMGEDPLWEVQFLVTSDHKDVLEVYRAMKNKNGTKVGKPLMTVTAGSDTDGLVDYHVDYVPKWKKNVLVTIWGYGAASQMIKVFDPNSKKREVCTFISSGPATVSVKKGQLVFSVPESSIEFDPLYKDFIVTDEFLTKECLKDNPSAPSNP